MPAGLQPGVVEHLSLLVRRVLCPNPGMMTGPGTNTYLVGRSDVAVIDPGPDHAEHLAAVADTGAGRIRWILVTHTHLDHSPGAAALRQRTGAAVLGFGTTKGPGHDEAFEADERISDGWVLEGPDFTLRAVHTPGHASNHLCYLLEGDGLLFTGDHVMQGSTVVISPPDGDMAAYLASLHRLLELPVRAIAPGHGHVIEDPRGAVEDYIAHRLAREEQVASMLGALGMATIDELVSVIYAEVAPALHPVARRSVHAHLLKLAAEGRASGSDIDGAWSPA